MRAGRWFIISATMLLLGAGCAASFSASREKNGPASPSAQTDDLPEYASRRTHRFSDNGREATFLILRLEPEKWEWDLASDEEHPKNVGAWRSVLGATLVVNGSYFNASGTPTGFYRDAPDLPKSRIPWPKKDDGYSGAVLIKDDDLTLAHVPTTNIVAESFDDVFLTFPTLIRDRKAAVEKESGLAARRTVLLEDANGVDYILVTEWGSVTLFELAKWLAQQPENFVRAVNLDGGTSTGLSLKDGSRGLEVRSSLVPNVVALKKK